MGLAAPDYDLDCICLAGDRCESLDLGVLTAGEIEPVRQHRVEARVGESLDLRQGHALTEQARANRAVVALRLLMEQADNSHPQGEQIVRMNGERNLLRIAARHGHQIVQDGGPLRGSDFVHGSHRRKRLRRKAPQ